jgi:hypothetical protein
VYRYRCDQCATTSLPVRTRAEQLADRDRHRRQMHGGHIPDGEHLLRQRAGPRPDGFGPATVLIILLGLLLLALINHH